MNILVGIFNLHEWSDLVADVLVEQCFVFLSDDQDDLSESCSVGIVDREVDDAFTVVANDIDLL